MSAELGAVLVTSIILATEVKEHRKTVEDRSSVAAVGQHILG
jgi:hypothetical protein